MPLLLRHPESAVAPAAIATALSGTAAAFGRAERVSVDGREVVVLLAKNPTGANENLRTVALETGPIHVLMSLEDRTADGRDISWIWDVDLEEVLARVASLTLSGSRAHDLALRVRYSGASVANVMVEPDPGRALDHALEQAGTGGRLYSLPTYTAMLDLRAILDQRGVTTSFWSGA
jgi:lipid II isoglutaminyl synthase (glutamine-hydrolysing)